MSDSTQPIQLTAGFRADQVFPTLTPAQVACIAVALVHQVLHE